MKVDGLSVEDVFSQCVFKNDEREMVLRAVQLVQPKYQPLVSKDQPVCSLPLVKQFYAEVLFYFFYFFYLWLYSDIVFYFILKALYDHQGCIYLIKIW